MTAVFIFGLALVLAVLISELAERTVLSTAVLFLAAGFLAGPGVLGLVPVDPQNPVVERLAELALFSVLFTDGLKVRFRALVAGWELPTRALLLGMPLTLLGTALLARLLGGLSWPESFLVGAVLSPTDPVFAAAIVGRMYIPHRLRHLLNIESGVNDGLALPVVLALLASLGGRQAGVATVLEELALGVAIGVALPWAVCRVERTRYFAVSRSYQPLFAFAIGLLVLSTSWLTGANEYLAAFAAGVTLGNLHPKAHEESDAFGEALAELLKLAALLVFGALISPRFLGEIGPGGYAFAVLALVLVRPVALGLALLGTGLGRRELAAALWFGPRGFASVVYGLLLLRAGVAHGEEMFHLVALVVAGSILAHSSTDVVVARWFEGAEVAGQPAAGPADPVPVVKDDAVGGGGA